MIETKVIAEIGINHNGDYELAKSLIKESYLSDCYGIKFQYRNLDRSYIDNQAKEIGDDLLKSEIKRCYLNTKQICSLSDFCKEELGLKVGISFFSAEDINDFSDINKYFDFFKVPSVEFTNNELIKKLEETGKKIIFSTGCQDEKTILKQIKSLNPDNSILMHCISNYPLEIYNAKLGYLKHLKEIWKGEIGYSSHDKDWKVCISALTIGVSYIERHITKNKMEFGLDHSTSSTPEEFKELCYFAKELPLALQGEEERVLNAGELINKQNLGRSPYLTKSVKKGEILKRNDFVWRSPQVGLTYENIDEYICKKLIKSIHKTQPLCIHHYEEKKYTVSEKDHWLENKKISIPVRIHDAKKIKRILNVKHHELHLSYSEVLSKDLLNRENYFEDIKYSIHLPDYIDSNTILDPFSEDKVTKNKSNEIIKNCVELSLSLFELTKKEIPIVGSFSTLHKSKEYSINLINDFCKNISNKNKYFLVPQLLPPVAWYFGGSVKLELFNSLEDLKIMQKIECDYCLDISHAFMCGFKEKNFLTFLSNNFNLVKHLHIAGAEGLDGEGESLKKMTALQQKFLNEVMDLPCIKVIEVWQGHLNNFIGFKKALCELEEIIL